MEISQTVMTVLELSLFVHIGVLIETLLVAVWKELLGPGGLSRKGKGL